MSPWRLAVGGATGLVLLCVAVVNRPPCPLARLDGTCRTLADSILTALDGEADHVRFLHTPGGEIADFAVRIDGALVLGQRVRLERIGHDLWQSRGIPGLPVGQRTRPLHFDPLPRGLDFADTAGGLRAHPVTERAWFLNGERWIDGVVVRLPLWRFNGEPLPWHGEAPVIDSPADLELRFDADGNLLEARDLLIRSGTTGSGLVFDPNPVVASGQRDLRNGDPVDSWRVEVFLEHMDATGRLRGERVCVDSRDRLYAQEEDHRFHYRSEDPRFEEVMAYYHIDRARSWLDSLGYGELFPQAQPVTVHASPLDNSWYSPITGRISYGDGGVDDPEDADIILHELGHAVHDAFVPGFGEGDTRAISEGFADYLAATITGEPCIGDWDATSYSPPCLRRTDTHLRFPDDVQGNPHADGAIWSGALWEIRTTLGRSAADLLVLEGLLRQTPSSTFSDAAEELIRAGEAIGLVGHLNEIRGILADRGLLGRAGMLQLAGDDGVVVPLDKRWPGAPDAIWVGFHADGSATIGDSLTILPFRVLAATRTEISYAATDTGFGWEWKVSVGNRDASGRVTLAGDGSLDLVWLGEYACWPEGEIGLLADTGPLHPMSLAEAFGGPQAPANLTVRIGELTEQIRDSRVTLRRLPAGWEIEMWLAPPSSDGAVLVALSHPSLGEAPIRLDLPESGPAHLAVYDVTGRRIRTMLAEESMSRGPHRIVWDGRDEIGRPVPAGIYWVRLRAGRLTRSLRIVWMGD